TCTLPSTGPPSRPGGPSAQEFAHMNSPRTVHWLAISTYLALIALLLLWLIWLDPPVAAVRAPALLLLLGPLLLPLRGILHGRRYTVAWSTMLILLYFAHGIAAVAGNGLAVWL